METSTTAPVSGMAELLMLARLATSGHGELTLVTVETADERFRSYVASSCSTETVAIGTRTFAVAEITKVEV